MDGEELTAGEDYTWDPETGTLVINADAVTGEIEIIAAAVESAETRTYLLGDVDGDGEVTAYDVTWLARYVANVEISIDIDSDASDIDGDGEVTPLDVTLLARYIAGWDQGYDIGTEMETEI